MTSVCIIFYSSFSPTKLVHCSIEYCTSNDCCLYWKEATYFSRERNRLVWTTNFIVILQLQIHLANPSNLVFVSARCNSWLRECYKNSIKCTSKILRICVKYRMVLYIPGGTRGPSRWSLWLWSVLVHTADINLKHTRYQRMNCGQITIITCVADSTCACRPLNYTRATCWSSDVSYLIIFSNNENVLTQYPFDMGGLGLFLRILTKIILLSGTMKILICLH